VCGKDFEEIVEIVADVHGKVVLENPMQGFGKEIENVGSGVASKAEDNVIKIFIVPCKAKEVPVCMADGNVTKGRL
jgi:hypothetical protein